MEPHYVRFVAVGVWDLCRSVRDINDLLDRKGDMIWDDLDISPRTCASPRALFCRYQRWFARPPHVPRRKSALKLHLPNGTLRTFMRFRLGCHDLPIDKGRQQGIPRDQRICTRCSLELVGDEHHLLFTCPAVQHVRQQFMHLFQQTTDDVHHQRALRSTSCKSSGLEGCLVVYLYQ